MKSLCNFFLFSATLSVAFAAAESVPAQDPFNPFGGQPPVAGPDPAAAPGEPAAQAASEDERNPVVLAIRDSNPTTPKELMFAIRSLFDIGRTDEAKKYLKNLLAANPDRAALVELQNEYGSAVFFQFSRDHRLQPEGAELAKAVREAAYQAARDPARLNQLIRQLSDPPRRYSALQELKAAGRAAVKPMLDALADPARADEHAAVRNGLAELGEPVVAPLIGALETSDARLRTQVIRTLGTIRAREAVRHLVGPFAMPGGEAEVRQAAGWALGQIVGDVPSERDVEIFLDRQARKFYEGALPAAVDYEDMITVWRWDEQSKSPVSLRVPAKDAAIVEAAKLARQLYAIAPDNGDYLRLFLLTNLEAGVVTGTLMQPLPGSQASIFAVAAAAGAEVVEDTFEHAIGDDRALAAVAAAAVLGEIGDASLLQSSGGQPRALAKALRHGDRRLRFAAADAIMRIDPQQPYAGSSFLAETLAFAARTVGSRRALVVHPRLSRARDLVGLLAQIGYESDAVSTGRDAFRLAARNPDFEFVLLSDSTDRPSVSETIDWFRRDPRTSKLPIAVIAREENLRESRLLAERDPLLLAFPQPRTASGMKFPLVQLMDAIGRGHVGYDERLDQASVALDHFQYLAKSPHIYHFYDLHRHEQAIETALGTPSLSEKASAVLGLLGSPGAQRALVTLASQHARPLSERKAALDGFATAVEAHGVLLTSSEILRQYETYNQSERLDAETQQILGAILDVIEKPAKQVAAKEHAAQENAAPPAAN